MSKTVRMPRGLGTEGQKLWKSVTAEFDLSADPHKQRILFDACKTADVIARLDAEAAKEPLTVKGSMGQKVIHPCIAQAQTARGTLATLLGKIGFPDTAEESEAKQEHISRVRRDAVSQRRDRQAKLRVVDGY